MGPRAVLPPDGGREAWWHHPSRLANTAQHTRAARDWRPAAREPGRAGGGQRSLACGERRGPRAAAAQARAAGEASRPGGSECRGGEGPTLAHAERQQPSEARRLGRAADAAGVAAPPAHAPRRWANPSAASRWSPLASAAARPETENAMNEALPEDLKSKALHCAHARWSDNRPHQPQARDPSGAEPQTERPRAVTGRANRQANAAAACPLHSSHRDTAAGLEQAVHGGPVHLEVLHDVPILADQHPVQQSLFLILLKQGAKGAAALTCAGCT